MHRNWLEFYFSFKGRATRYDFNVYYALAAFAGSIVAGCIDLALAGGDVLQAAQMQHVSTIWNFLIIIPTFAVTAKQLHDVNCSGWWQAVVLVVSLAGAALYLQNPMDLQTMILDPQGFAPEPVTTLVVALTGFILLAGLLFLSLKRGTNGPNKYGPDPLQNTTETTP